MFHAQRLQLVFASLLIILCQACAAKQQVMEPSQAALTPSATQQEIVPSQAAIVATTSPVHPPPTEPVQEEYQVTQAINAITGGEVSLTVANGDLIQLVIPPFALTEDTDVSLVAYSNPLSSPFKAHFFPGVSIQPDGLSLRLPASLTITPSSHEFTAGERLFYLKSSDLAIPLWQSDQVGTSLTGKLNHFSQYIGGSPSDEEARSQADAASDMGGDFPDEWRDSIEGNQALSEWGNLTDEMGWGDDSSEAINKARERLINDLECLMDLNCSTPPLDPCGDYQQMLMQYFKQANLLAIDPDSEMMQYLYDLLQQVLNECTNRYALEYAHNLRVNQMGLEQEIQVTGEVIFHTPMYGVFELGEPLKMEGSGYVDVTIGGQMTSDEEVCVIDGSGENSVTISGQLEADEMGNPWIALDVNEQWYTTASMTVTCSDGDSQTVPLPALGNQSFPLRFQYEDGAKSTAPNLGGMQGEYVWILHILHTW